VKVNIVLFDPFERSISQFSSRHSVSLPVPCCTCRLFTPYRSYTILRSHYTVSHIKYTDQHRRESQLGYSLAAGWFVLTLVISLYSNLHVHQVSDVITATDAEGDNLRRQELSVILTRNLSLKILSSKVILIPLWCLASKFLRLFSK
jgi:hypothetical protein